MRRSKRRPIDRVQAVALGRGAFGAALALVKRKDAKAGSVHYCATRVWNALDADATQIDVELRRNQMEGLTGVPVSDNGHGLPNDEADDAFQKLGGSWKKNALKTKGKRRMLHGQLGRGRFKAFAIANFERSNLRG